VVAKVYRVKLKPQPVGYCTWYHAHASSEKELPAQTAFAADNLKPFGFSFIQIDDGWQDGLKANGPMKNFSQVKSTGPYPSGMKSTAADIIAHGLTPDLFERDMPRIWTVNGPDSRTIVGLFNWEKEDREIDYPVERLGLKPGVEYAAFEYWTNKLITPIRDRLRFKLPASSRSVRWRIIRTWSAPRATSRKA
jgi:alpha galactosidase C-like protein